MFKPIEPMMNSLKSPFKKNKIIIIFFVVLLIYSFSNRRALFKQQIFSHYNYLADSFLKGQVNIDNPPTRPDFILFNNKTYVVFPILPAIILMPFVLFFGVSFNNIYLILIVGSMNIVLIYKLLRKINPNSYVLLTFAFAFGTVHWWASIQTGSWTMAQIFAVFFLILALIESLGKRRPVILALLAGCAFMCRQLTILSAPYFLYIILKKDLNYFSLRSPCFKKIMIFLIVLFLFVSLFLIYNYIRFGNPLDTGYNYLQIEGILKRRYLKGLFAFSHLPFNLYIFLFQPPIFTTQFPFIDRFDPQGLALIFASPFLFYAFRNSLKKTLHVWISCIFIFLPQLFYHNTGFWQFGYRFILDILPFLILLVGYVKFNRRNYFLLLLVIYSIIINLLGVLWQFRFFRI